MANEEHLARLKQGGEAWNRWRQEHPEVHLNLSQADLHEVRLHEANLRGAILSKANLRGASLDRANLCEADLYRADLREADLSGAHLVEAHLCRARLNEADLSTALLSRADLHEADLRGADLTAADLEEADLSGANLSGADLTGAELTGTILDRANLSEATLSDANLHQAQMQGTVLNFLDLRQTQGLETVRHRGPSDLGMQTLSRSWGELPLSFLRGVGISDSFITSLGAFFSQPQEACSCLISHSDINQVFVERLAADLQQNGVRCWLAPGGIPDELSDLDRLARLHDKLLLVLSRATVLGRWMKGEVNQFLAWEHEKQRAVVVPICLDAEVLALEEGWLVALLDTHRLGDFTHWKDHDAYQAAFARLLLDLQAEHP